MKTIKEVRAFFEGDLKVELHSLEELRLNINQQYSFRHYRLTLKILGILSVAAIITSMVLPNSPLRWGTMLVPFTALVAIVYPIILVSLRASKFKAVNRKYKEEIIPRVLTFVQPRLTYFPDKGMSVVDIENSMLFERDGLRCRSKDLVEGSVEGFRVQFAEVGIFRVSSILHGSRRHRRTPIFAGMFFQIDLGRKLLGRTLVLPDIREGISIKMIKRLFGDAAEEVIERLGERIESLGGELIKMHDARFEKFFSVYAQNETEARALLTPSFMHKLVDFREKNNLMVQLSFTGQYLNLAIDASDMFEGGVDDSFLRFENFADYVEILLLLVNVVNEIPSEFYSAATLNSNTRGTG